MAKRGSSSSLNNDFDTMFGVLPAETDDQYTIRLKSIVLDRNLITSEQALEQYMCSETSKYRFAAFYSLLIICREYNNYSKYNSYVEKYANQFSNYQLHKIVQSTYYRNKGMLGEKNCYERAIKYAEQACFALPSNLAVKHHFAAILVQAIEEQVSVVFDDINKAIERLDDVIDAFPGHALYYCTRGRLYAATGDYQRGILNLKKALDLEEGLDKDSMIRIGDYNYHLLQIKMMQENSIVDNKIGEFNSTFLEMKNNLDSVKTQYLEYLAFFSSILAFILASINTVGKIDDFNKCAGIILMFAGTQVLVFGVFRMLLYFSSRIKFSFWKISFCYLVGILLLVCGFLIGNQAFWVFS